MKLQDFMEYLIAQEGFSDPYESGVKISSIALAIHVTKKNFHSDLQVRVVHSGGRL